MLCSIRNRPGSFPCPQYAKSGYVTSVVFRGCDHDKNRNGTELTALKSNNLNKAMPDVEIKLSISTALLMGEFHYKL